MTMTASQTWDLPTTCSIQGRRKFLATRARTPERNWGRWHKSRILIKRRKRKILGPDDYVPATGDYGNQKSNQGCLGDISQVQTGANIEKLPARTKTPAIRRSDNSDDMPRIGNMDTHQRARENDTADATQNDPTHHTKEKNIQKDLEKKKTTNEEKTPTTWVAALVTKVKTGKAQTLTKTRTATCLSITILKKKWILQR